MAERNLIKEGFVVNTLTEAPAISGTQIITIPEMNLLIDEDFVTTALTVTGSETVALETDLGARWRLNRIEYYTDETSASNILMEISDNRLDFFEVTMTGSNPLYVGDISPVVVSGAPRYIRLTHTPSINTDVQEWRAINDETLVDFGTDGTQTQIEIEDAPIGRPSNQVQTLILFNKFTGPVVGFVFIDNTSTDADDEIEISTSPSGPFFGRQTSNARQPDITPWGAGTGTNTRVTTSGAYFVDFKADGNKKGWDGSGFDSVVASGGALKGNTTSLSPRFHILNEYTTTTRKDTTGAFLFTSRDFDRVLVKLKVPTQGVGVVTEGPRLFWRNNDIETGDFDTVKSTVSTTGDQVPFTNQIQDFTFNVDQIPSWSGTIRGFGVRPFTLVSGTAIPIELHSLEAFHSSGQERLALGFRAVTSGTAPVLSIDDTSADDANLTVISFNNIISEKCIITRVKAFQNPPNASFQPIVFLAAFNDGDKTIGSNYTIKRMIKLEDSGGAHALATDEVYWPAEPGDVIGYTITQSPAAPKGLRFESGNLGDSYRSSTGDNSSTIGGLQTHMDGLTLVAQSSRYLLDYTAVASGRFFASGVYISPVFDGGSDPALLSATFEAIEEDGSSVDSSGSNNFDSIRARASATPPEVSSTLGDVLNGPSFLNWNVPAASQTDFTINTKNGPVATRESVNVVQNYGGSAFYHEQKNEIWVLNLVGSGTATDFRPTWDAFDPDSLTYIRTQAVGGDINYSYQHPGDALAFEGVGFVADYTDEEIYIIQRENAFFVGAGNYYGIVLDLDGNFKEVFMRSDTLGEPDSSRLESMQGVAYDGTYFYTIAEAAAGSSDEGDLITIYRNGTSSDARDIDFIAETLVEDITGLEFTSGSIDLKGMAFNTRNNLFYLYFHNTTGSEGTDNINPEIFTLQIAPNNVISDLNDGFTFSLQTISGTSSNSIPEMDGFSREAVPGDDDWTGLRVRNARLTSAMFYMNARDSFGLLQTREAVFSEEFRGFGKEPLTDFFLYNYRNLSFFGGNRC